MAEAAIDMTEFAGAFAEGYTPEDIRWASSNLTPVLGGDLVCVWDYIDAWGAGGDSQVGIQRSPGGVIHEVALWVWDWLVEGTVPPPDPGPATTGEVLLDPARDACTQVDLTSYARTDQR